MAQTIYIKNSEVAGVTPGSLGKGEIAINISDGNLFYGDAGGNVSQNFSFLNSGATSIGALTATSGTFRSNVNISGDTHFPDNGKAIFGAGEDLKIYHSGSHSIIQDAGQGDLQIKGSIIKIRGTSVSEDCAVFTENGSVELYYDNAKKLETTSVGVTVTGTLAATLSTATQNFVTGLGTVTSGIWNNDRLFTVQTAEEAWMGDYVTFGDEVATTPGSLYYFNGETWIVADANAVASSTGMLGIALGETTAAGLLIRGMYGLLSYDPGSAGEVLYVSEAAGKIVNAAPTTAAAVVRVVGYAMSDTPQFWFNPDNTWVELS